MEKSERIAFLERGINSELTPEHLRLEMQETLSELLKPEPTLAPPKAKRPRVMRKPTVVAVPVPAPAPPPPPRELTAEEAEAREEEYRRRRDRRAQEN